MALKGKAAAILSAAAAAFGVLGGTSFEAEAQGTSPLAGIWLDDEAKGGVEIKPCGDSLCGNIVWMKQPLNPQGQPWTDQLNSDASKRARPVCGLQIIGGLKKDSDTVWKDGWVYDPEEGKQYDVELTLADPNTLTVHGYLGVKLLGEKLTWKRMPNDTPRCKA